MKLRIIYISFCFLILSCCKKHITAPINNYGLPPASEIGAGVLACLLNGKPWIADVKIFPPGIPCYFATYSFGISGSVEHHDFEDITLQINQSTEEIKINNSYDLSDTALCFGFYRGGGEMDSCFGKMNSGYGTSWSVYSVEGSLMFTKIDTLKHIVSGVFSFDVISNFCDTLKFTHGRFDQVYYH